MGIEVDTERYEEQRKKHFWEFFGLVFLLLLIVGCKSIDYTSGVPEPYNLTLMGNSTGIVELTQMVNTSLMQGYLGVMLMVLIFIISVGAFMVMTAHAGKAFAASSFIMFLSALFLRNLRLIDDWAIYVSLAIFALSVAFLKSKDWL